MKLDDILKKWLLPCKLLKPGYCI